MLKSEMFELFKKMIEPDVFSERHLDIFENFYLNFKDEYLNDLKLKLDEDSVAYVAEESNRIAEFQKRLFSTWEKPINRLDMMIVSAREIGHEVNEEYRRGDIPTSPKKNVLTRLQARAVQIACEISHLLKGGFADGAFARWRSIHETAVIARLISNGDDELASRFLDYHAVLKVKLISQYTKYSDDLGFENFSQSEIEKYQKDKDAMEGRYGKDFVKTNGWAGDVIGKAGVTFEQIEEFVKMDFLRPHYKFSSQNIHSGVDSIAFKLGLSMSEDDILLSGPSNEGFIEPLQCTSLSLCQITTALSEVSEISDISDMNAILWRMHDSMKIEAKEASDALQAKGDAIKSR